MNRADTAPTGVCEKGADIKKLRLAMLCTAGRGSCDYTVFRSITAENTTALFNFYRFSAVNKLYLTVHIIGNTGERFVIL